MGVVVVQLGQGGNQMGFALFQCLASMSASTATEFFRPSPTAGRFRARAVLVDMEPKVVAAIIKRAKVNTTEAKRTHWTYDTRRQVTHDSGSGNNWARGYYDHGPKCVEAILDAVRLEVEDCDIFGGFLTLQSMAGGTGAGLGTGGQLLACVAHRMIKTQGARDIWRAYLVEALKDEFPSSFTLSHCIWPYESGEVIVQNYNVLLTVSHLQNFADAVVIVQNEQLSAICRSLLGIQRPSFDEMNDVAAQALGCVLLPSHWRPIQRSSQATCDLGIKGKSDLNQGSALDRRPCIRLLSDLVAVLCAHPGYRMLTMRFTPQVPAQSLDFTNFTWGAQLKHLRQMLITGACKELDMDWNVSLPTSHEKNSSAHTYDYRINRSLANVLILRGRESEYADVTGFADERMYPIWQVEPLSVAASPVPYGKYEMATGLLSNCQSSVLPASRALSKAYNMYASKAYLYQYFEHGMESVSFDSAFATVEDVVARYLAL